MFDSTRVCRAALRAMHWHAYPGDPALASFTAVEVEGARVLVREGYEAFAALLAGGEHAGGEHVGGGREAHPVVELPTGERVVVRRYRRGGLVRHFNRAHYFAGHRAFDELRATERARAAGVRAPAVVAAVERPEGLGYTARLATVLVPGARTLDACLSGASGADRMHLFGEAGRQIGRMHAARVTHPDLNLRNLLVSTETNQRGRPLLYLLDFDRARVLAEEVPRGGRERDLQRLGRSARKLGLALGPSDWVALREGYQESAPLEALPTP
ncbi:MAG TPA: lipopolysaccharide kinase InaA family protein [Longimicrobiaceae bacterium]|nr:lipopolysaccharide kinase InaA family protein [Longimicrobiaceae bacterium]